MGVVEPVMSNWFMKTIFWTCQFWLFLLLWYLWEPNSSLLELNGFQKKNLHTFCFEPPTQNLLSVIPQKLIPLFCTEYLTSVSPQWKEHGEKDHVLSLAEFIFPPSVTPFWVHVPLRDPPSQSPLPELKSDGLVPFPDLNASLAPMLTELCCFQEYLRLC